MKSIITALQFAGSNSNSSSNHVSARLNFRFKAIIFALASIIFGLSGAFAQSANCMRGDAVAENIKYFVNGNEVSALSGNVKPGSDVMVTFTTRKGTSKTRFSLVSYKTPGPTFDANTADQQKLFEMETGLFEPGKHVMQIQVPNCYFEIDFVKGCVINKQGPAGTNNFYGAQGRLIASDYGGTKPCNTCPANVDVNFDNEFNVGYPDTTVEHIASFTNLKNGNDRINIKATSEHNWKIELRSADGSVLMASDKEGNGSWDYVNSSYDKDNDGNPETDQLASDETQQLMFLLYIPADAEIGLLDTLKVNGSSSKNDCATDNAYAITEVDEPFVLPIELITFTAGLNGKVVRLDWATATEINNDYFSIERSSDGKEFEEVLVVRGAGNTNSISRYSIEDKEPLTGVSYYRLKQTDFDGKSETFNVIVVNNSKVAQTISIHQDAYPNPFNEKFILGFTVADRGQVVITLNDIQGRQLKTMVVNADKGSNTLEFSEGSDLPKGIYFINLQYNGEVINIKMIKNGSDALTGL